MSAADSSSREIPGSQIPGSQIPGPQIPGPLRRIWIQASYDTRLTMANGEQILLTLIIPIAVLLGLLWATGLDVLPNGADPTTPRIDLVLPGAISVAVLSSAFASLAIGTGFDRRSGSLLLLATTPLSRAELLWARAASTLSIVVGQVIILCLVAVAFGWRPGGRDLLAFPLIVLGAVSLAACGIMIAGLLRAEATLALANGVFLILLVAGGTAVPLSSLPAGIDVAAGLLPSGALAESLRWSLIDLPGGSVLPVIVMVAWALAAAVITRRTFRWD